MKDMHGGQAKGTCKWKLLRRFTWPLHSRLSFGFPFLSHISFSFLYFLLCSVLFLFLFLFVCFSFFVLGSLKLTERVCFLVSPCLRAQLGVLLRISWVDGGVRRLRFHRDAKAPSTVYFLVSLISEWSRPWIWNACLRRFDILVEAPPGKDLAAS